MMNHGPLLFELCFDGSCSLLNHGVAQRKRLNLGNLNPIYERELTKLGVYHEVRAPVGKDVEKAQELTEMEPIGVSVEVTK